MGALSTAPRVNHVHALADSGRLLTYRHGSCPMCVWGARPAKKRNKAVGSAALVPETRTANHSECAVAARNEPGNATPSGAQFPDHVTTLRCRRRFFNVRSSADLPYWKPSYAARASAPRAGRAWANMHIVPQRGSGTNRPSLCDFSGQA